MAVVLSLAALIACSDPPRPSNELIVEEGSPEGERDSRAGKRSSPGPDGDPLPPSEASEDGAPGDERETTPAPPPATCAEDTDCNAPGRICENGACLKGCRTSDQCEAGQACNAGQCATNEEAAECLADEQCDLGTICITGACTLGCYSTYDCPVGQSCGAGQCKSDAPAEGGEATCTSDGQCNPGNNGTGKICGADGTCVPGCRKDYHCPGASICVAGQCG